jgi:hypothetical protein
MQSPGQLLILSQADIMIHPRKSGLDIGQPSETYRQDSAALIQPQMECPRTTVFSPTPQCISPRSPLRLTNEHYLSSSVAKKNCVGASPNTEYSLEFQHVKLVVLTDDTQNGHK